MANNQSESCPYKSRFGGGFLSPAQYLAETMVARIAVKDKIDLPQQFWNIEKWKRVFLLQLRFANSLLKVYSFESIANALKSVDGRKIHSLGAKFLDPLIREQEEKLRVKKVLDIPKMSAENVVEIAPPRPKFVPKKSLKDKLD